MASSFIIFACLWAFSFAQIQINYKMPNVQTFGDPFKINRVVGGKNAAKGEFPHQVSLQWGYPPYSSFTHICGGTIIAQSWILTAGHCVTNLPESGVFLVRAGKTLIKVKEATEQAAVVERVVIHRDYEGSVSPFDIALLKLRAPLKFNSYVAPISLPEPDSMPQGLVTLSGWGSISKTALPVLPNALQKVTLPLLDLGTCRRAMRLLGEHAEVHDTNICTGPLTGGYSACNGDSGGPLIKTNEKGQREIIGIVSWGLVPCAGVGAPAIFVRVSAFIDWINAAVTTFGY